VDETDSTCHCLRLLSWATRVPSSHFYNYLEGVRVLARINPDAAPEFNDLFPTNEDVLRLMDHECRQYVTRLATEDVRDAAEFNRVFAGVASALLLVALAAAR
jgi:hypothetical protein